MRAVFPVLIFSLPLFNIVDQNSRYDDHQGLSRKSKRLACVNSVLGEGCFNNWFNYCLQCHSFDFYWQKSAKNLLGFLIFESAIVLETLVHHFDDRFDRVGKLTARFQYSSCSDEAS